MEEKKDFVSQRLTVEDLESLPENCSMFLHAGVGKGKTYFSLNVVYDYAIKHHLRILHLSSRTVLRKQVHADVKNDQKTRIIETLTYQAWENDIKSGKNFYIESFGVIILDEFQHFAVDFPVSVDSGMLIPHILQANALKVFMSGTPGKVTDYLMKRMDEQGLPYIEPYEFPANYDTMSLDTFNVDKKHPFIDHARNFIEIAKQMRWRILICSQDIESLYKLWLEDPEQRLFFCSQYQSNDIYLNAMKIHQYDLDKLIETAKLQHDVLLTTTAMDVGFNIKNSQVGMVVCDLQSLDQIVQMSGRRRVTHSKDNFVLLVSNITPKKARAKIKTLEKDLMPVRLLEELGQGEYLRRYPWPHHTSATDMLIRPEAKECGNDIYLKTYDMGILYAQRLIDEMQLFLDSGKSYKKFLSEDYFHCKKVCVDDILTKIRRNMILKKYLGIRISGKSKTQLAVELAYKSKYRKIIKDLNIIQGLIEDDSLAFRLKKYPMGSEESKWQDSWEVIAYDQPTVVDECDSNDYAEVLMIESILD